MAETTNIMNYLIECLVIILLVITIFYCYYLDKIIKNFQKKQIEFAPAVENLNRVTLNAEKVVGVLKDTTNSSNQDLKKTISKAKIVADDLSFLVEVGSKISHTLSMQMQQGNVNTSASNDFSNSNSTSVASDTFRGGTDDAEWVGFVKTDDLTDGRINRLSSLDYIGGKVKQGNKRREVAGRYDKKQTGLTSKRSIIDNEKGLQKSKRNLLDMLKKVR